MVISLSYRNHYLRNLSKIKRKISTDKINSIVISKESSWESWRKNQRISICGGLAKTYGIEKSKP
jgi:hypothetical protein